MARRRATTADIDPFADLARKTEILARELEVQRVAIDRLKELGKARPQTPRVIVMPERKSA